MLLHSHSTTTSGISASYCSTATMNRRRSPHLKERDQVYLTQKMNMASTSKTRIKIRKFDDKHFTLWKEMMQDVLIIRRQVEEIHRNEKPASMTIEEWKLIDEIARSTICMHLAENLYFRMAKETTMFKLWEKLQAVYKKQSSSSKLILIRTLSNMKMRETDHVTSHINTFSRVLSELSSQGINFEEEVKALTLLSSLPTSWEVFCTTFANSCLKLNLDETIGQVLIEEIRRKSMGLTIDESAEAHNSTKSVDWFNHSRKQAERIDRNSTRPRQREDRQRSKSRNSQSSVFYANCRKIGHEISDCRSFKRKGNGRQFERNT